MPPSTQPAIISLRVHCTVLTLSRNPFMTWIGDRLNDLQSQARSVWSYEPAQQRHA